MLSPGERLRRTSVFQRAYTGRKSISTDWFTLYVILRHGKVVGGARLSSNQAAPVAPSGPKQRVAGAPVSPLESFGGRRWPLVGFVVSKKMIRSACLRNRAKRRMREAYRHLRSSETEGKGVSSGELVDVNGSLQQWYALVWVINEKVLMANWDEICKKMEECLLRASKKYGQNKSAH